MVSYLFLAVALTVATVALPARRDTSPTYFFTFGDSYSQTDFNTTGQQPSATDPMGNPALGQGTTSGGVNWIGYLTATYNTTLVLNYNLAAGGATIDNDIVSDPSQSDDLVSQVRIFESTYGNRPNVAQWTPDNTVFGVWIGINDVGYAYSSSNAQNLTVTLINRYQSLIEQLYTNGARKFLILNVPATSRSPLIQSQGAAAAQAHAAFLSGFNDGIGNMTAQLQRKHTDMTIVLYDSWTFMTLVLDSPTSYGYNNTDAASCYNADGATCVWWNNYHPGYKYHQLQAANMAPQLMPLSL